MGVISGGLMGIALDRWRCHVVTLCFSSVRPEAGGKAHEDTPHPALLLGIPNVESGMANDFASMSRPP